MKTIIIAEAGINHNGSLKRAIKMIDIASRAKADFIKFQTFVPENLAHSNSILAKYQKKNTKYDDQFDMLKKLCLSFDDFKKIKKKCIEKKIKFLSSPFDETSINFLKKIKVEYIKIPSGEITNIPYLKKIGKLKTKVILSTGMATLSEIKIAMNILIQNGTRKSKITILHCNTQYPASISDLNLLSIKYIKDKLKVKVGYSDHSLGYEASLIALGLGAKVLEKHFTLNKKLIGPDHKSSLSPNELKEYVLKVREFEKAIGKYQKKPSIKEKENINVVRKQIVANNDIQIGDRFSIKNITTKRSKKGIPSSKWDFVVGKKSRFRFFKDQNIKI